MPKIIFTSRYIKNPASSNAGKLIKYMGTREGVEKIPNGIDNSPVTKKQNDLICTALKTVPESWDYPEMKFYLENKTKANATEFLNEFLERNADRIGSVKKLVNYYAERPGVERLGKHGLFSQTDDKINLDEVADDVSNHNGIVWTHVISLKREDAERLGYNNANAWKNLVTQRPSFLFLTVPSPDGLLFAIVITSFSNTGYHKFSELSRPNIEKIKGLH